MGLSIPLRALARARPGDLRVASFNAEGKPVAALGLSAFAFDVRPDVIALQECRDPAEDLAKAFPGWAVHADLEMCLLSRHPIRKVEARDRADVWERGGNGGIARYTIALPAREVTLVSLHLETPRDAIEALVERGWEGAAEHDRNVELRSWESQLAREWVDAAVGPVVVAGDFNMPVDSAIYRRFWSGFDNAFSRAGLGFGATKRTRWFGVRIDHVLAGPGFQVEDAWIGPDLGSDHRPILADLRWVGAR
jgi:endonuclease/exonuclease/phosphatase (EEP) superfamily protein YafD